MPIRFFHIKYNKCWQLGFLTNNDMGCVHVFSGSNRMGTEIKTKYMNLKLNSGFITNYIFSNKKFVFLPEVPLSGTRKYLFFSNLDSISNILASLVSDAVLSDLSVMHNTGVHYRA